MAVVEHEGIETRKTEPSERLKFWANLLAPAVGAVVLGIAGWVIQARIAAGGNDREYVQLAISILREPAGGPGGERAALRKWAADIVDEYAPIKLTPEGRAALLQGELGPSWQPPGWQP
jgi:hypothetical protein